MLEELKKTNAPFADFHDKTLMEACEALKSSRADRVQKPNFSNLSIFFIEKGFPICD